ncbi:MAG: hypothetical protein ABW110_00460 [Steroidobacteraceae bacterium]
MSSHASAHAARPAAPAARTTAPVLDADTDLLRLDLRDVPYMSPGLHVEALQPSLLSRFIGLFIR